MAQGFLTKMNKQEIIELIKTTIEKKYELTIDSIPNFTRIYDGVARKIHQSNPDNTLVKKNMLLIKELINMLKKKYEYKLEKQKVDKQTQNKQTTISNEREEYNIKNEIISDNNNVDHTIEIDTIEKTSQKKDNINEGIRDEEIVENDANDMLEALMKQRDMDINSVTNNNKTNENKTNENKTIGNNVTTNESSPVLRDTIIKLDDDMTFKIKFNKIKKPDTLYFKKLLLGVDDLDEDVLDIPYFIVTIGSNSRYFFNNGLNGNYCIFDTDLDFPINIHNKNSLIIEITNPTGDIYKQKNVLVYLKY